MKPVFVDTGAWIAAIEPADSLHARGAAYLEQLVGAGTPLLTTNYVVSETATRLRYDSGLDTALRFRAQLDRAAPAGRLRIAWIDESIERAAWELLERYDSLTLSLTDATSAVVAREAKIKTMFSFDADFRALGFDLQPAR